jgi:hypothetical protein
MMDNLARTVLLLAWTIAAACSPVLGARGRQVGHALPIVVAMAPPTFPVFARLAHIQGVVRLKVTTDGQRVTNAQEQGKASPLLAGLAEKNVRTWQFEPGDPTTFTVTYTYSLVAYRISGADSTSITLRLPTDVEISATMPVNVDLAPDKRR